MYNTNYLHYDKRRSKSGGRSPSHRLWQDYRAGPRMDHAEIRPGAIEVEGYRTMPIVVLRHRPMSQGTHLGPFFRHPAGTPHML